MSLYINHVTADACAIEFGNNCIAHISAYDYEICNSEDDGISLVFTAIRIMSRYPNMTPGLYMYIHQCLLYVLKLLAQLIHSNNKNVILTQ